MTNNCKKCEKCGYQSEDNSEFNKKFGLCLCNVCYTFSPKDPEKLDGYVQEKINPQLTKELNKFRKYAKTRGEVQKQGMIKQASEGKHVSRVPFGYKWSNKGGKIIPAENYQEVE